MKLYEIYVDGIYRGKVYANSLDEVQTLYSRYCRNTLVIIG